jgi:hypothetical protein
VSIWKYFADRERELRECSLHIPDGIDLFTAEEDERRGKIFGRILFDGYPQSVYLAIHEDVVAKGTGFTRPRYAYFLVIGEREIGGFERHATHDPPVHKHCSGQRNHEASPCRVMSFKDAVKEAWKYVSEFAQPLSDAGD